MPVLRFQLEPEGASEGSCDSSISEPATFQAFAQTCAAIAVVRGKLDKIRLLAEYLRRLDIENVGRVATWFTGIPFAASDNKVLQLGWALLRDVVCAIAGVGGAEFHRIYLKYGDLGETAFEILQNR